MDINVQTNQQKPKLFKFIIGLCVVALLAVAAYFSWPMFAEDDTPPTLDTGTTTFQGFIKDSQGLYEYQASDVTAFVTPITTAKTLPAGIHFYYARQNMKVSDIVKSIKPIAGNKVLIAFYEPGGAVNTTAGFYVYPKGPFVGTTEISDTQTDTFVIPAYYSFIIIARDETQMWNLYGEKEASDKISPALTAVESGWALVPIDSTTSAAVSANRNRYKHVWFQKDVNSFDKIENTSGPVGDFKMMWVKLAKATTTTPTTCPKETKACPDGSTVAKTGPNCEFPACPEVSTTKAYAIADIGIWKDDKTACKAGEDCFVKASVTPSGKECESIYGKEVVVSYKIDNGKETPKTITASDKNFKCGQANPFTFEKKKFEKGTYSLSVSVSAEGKVQAEKTQQVKIDDTAVTPEPEKEEVEYTISYITVVKDANTPDCKAGDTCVVKADVTPGSNCASIYGKDVKIDLSIDGKNENPQTFKASAENFVCGKAKPFSFEGVTFTKGTHSLTVSVSTDGAVQTKATEEVTIAQAETPPDDITYTINDISLLKKGSTDACREEEDCFAKVDITPGGKDCEKIYGTEFVLNLKIGSGPAINQTIAADETNFTCGEANSFNSTYIKLEKGTYTTEALLSKDGKEMAKKSENIVIEAVIE